MSYSWSRLSHDRLTTCHLGLVHLFDRVIKRKDLPCDLTILCGHRSKAEQDAAFAKGASKLRYPKSKHNVWPSMAVDVAPYVNGAPSWDWDWYNKIAPIIKDEWALLDYPGFRLTWGGDWASFKDGPHWELSAK